MQPTCPSCNYQSRKFSKYENEIIYYKSGKNKGEIKEIKEVLRTYYEDDPDFIELRFKKEVDDLIFKYPDSYPWSDYATASLLACPKCGSIIIEQINSD